MCLIASNPFHGFLNTNVVLQSIFILGGDRNNINILPPDLVPLTLEMSEKVKNYLTFYSEQGAGSSIEQLIHLVYFEARVILDMIRNNFMILLDYDHHRSESKQLEYAYKSATYMHIPIHFIGKKIILKDDCGHEKAGTVYDIHGFQTRTLFNFLISDIAAEYNAPKVKDYIAAEGFTDVSIQKGINPHTGRKNVWMINAVKT